MMSKQELFSELKLSAQVILQQFNITVNKKQTSIYLKKLMTVEKVVHE